MGFEVVCEIEPATRPDLMHVRHQIGVLSRIAGAFLIPDNHLGRATVSSIAVAHEVQSMGGRSIACLNGRDRNDLGLQRDLLTAVAYGVDQFLLVAGDRRVDDAGGIRVSEMLDQVRTFALDDVLSADRGFRVGVTSRRRPLAAWKRDADFLFLQVGFDVGEMVRWRESIDFPGPVYAGVLVLASAAHGRKVAQGIPEITIPSWVHQRLEVDPNAGVDLACEAIAELRETAFDGVHLVPVGRYREVAARLEASGI